MKSVADGFEMEADAPQPDVNLSNWRQSPQNHRAFHHLPSEIATARVRSGSKGARFPSSSESIEAFSLRLPNGSSMGLEPFLAATSTPVGRSKSHGYGHLKLPHPIFAVSAAEQR